MDFLLNDIHTDLRDTVAAIGEKAGGVAIARSWTEGDHAPALSVYRRLAEAGVTGLVVDDALGGSGAGATELVVAAEQLGRFALPGPVAETFGAVPTALAAAGATDALATLLGGRPATLAAAATGHRAAAPADADVYLLRDGALSTASVVAEHASVDPTRTVADVGAGTSLGSADEAAVAQVGALVTAAQLIGLGAAMLHLASEYAKARKQFNRAIGSYQAVKHHLADVAIAVEMARPLVLGAAVGLDGKAPDEVNVARDVWAAKVAAADAAYLASRRSLQVFGAIGYTAEHDLSLYLTKTRALVSAWGTPAQHRAQILETL
ncbi:acyl-CoA dehydrogenase family protein [Gordonia hydrophobica]|uniref:Acyl-CoA dehydrogenase family protein n=1 Tax=Gordonia hydrophobica TaxID=40516 RepID=A0ABZ2U408_9ACTN|nr:acyl-CoA dehydrogenase family protein [Gordonia hydrophobica]MBM7367892.1 alkylation response protein AidB-like acyl-CoA dehydrogenase [Gordonia hydrophobica]